MKLGTFKTGRWYVDITNSAFAYYCKEIRRYDKTFNQCQVFLKHPFNDGSRHYSGNSWDDAYFKEVDAKEAFEINMRYLFSEMCEPSSMSKTDILWAGLTQEELYAKAFHKNVKKLKMAIDELEEKEMDSSCILINPESPIDNIACYAIGYLKRLTLGEINKRNDEA